MSPQDPAEPESPDSGAAERRRERPDRREYYRRKHVEYRNANPVGYWRRAALRGCRNRAVRHAVPFCLDESDIELPEFCPVLGLPLRPNVDCSDDCSPTVDRLVPKIGYVRGNIAVISHRANTIKNSGTAAEHRRIADWMDRMAAKSR